MTGKKALYDAVRPSIAVDDRSNVALWRTRAESEVGRLYFDIVSSRRRLCIEEFDQLPTQMPLSFQVS